MKKIAWLVLFSAGFLILLSHPVLAWLDCPNGKINDPSPGSCPLYADTNNNQICDHSEPDPEIGVQEEHFPFYLIFLTLVFYFLHWYLVYKTKLAKKFKWLNQAFFRFFWNVILLLTFLPAAISGVLLLLEIRSTFLLFLHHQIGLVFVVVGFIHLFGRLQYFIKRN